MDDNVYSYFGKHVEVKTDDGQVFKGFVCSCESIEDSDDGVASIDVEHTKQFPYNFVSLRTDEVVSIKVID